MGNRLKKAHVEALVAALDPPAGADALGAAFLAINAAVAQLERGLEWSEVARRGAESPDQLASLLLVPKLIESPEPSTGEYQEALAALWQLIRRLNEERELPRPG
jgi:hypothetical protein